MADPVTLTTTLLRDGFTFVESPRWRIDRLWFVDFFKKSVFTLMPDGELEAVAIVPGTPGGLGFLPDGTPLVVSQSDFKVMAIGRGGVLTQYADLSRHARGKANEMLVDPRGRCYVGHHGYDFFGGAEPQPASLVLVDETGRVEIAADRLRFPNGTALSADGRTLIVAESFIGRLTAFDVGADGHLSNRRIWAQLERDAVPDGICLDAAGALWVANPWSNVVWRVKEGGAITHRVPVGKWALACALGDADRRTLYCVTTETTVEDMPKGLCKGSVETVRVEIPGAGLP